MPQLTDFYRGRGPDSEGRMLEQIWAFSDGRLESVHDFIQWLFPLQERSGFNPNAPRLSAADIAAFRSDPTLRANLLRSLGVFLAFLGLRLDGGRVVEAADFEAKRDVWRFPNHNWLRITRVLASTRLLGLEAESRAFFAFLTDLQASGQSAISADTFDYWKQAAPGRSTHPGGGSSGPTGPGG